MKLAMKLALILLLQYPLAGQDYRAPAEQVLFPTGGRLISGCAVNRETGVITCGTDLPVAAVTNLSVAVK